MDPLTEALQTINDDNIIAIYKNTPVTKRCSGCKKNVEESKFIDGKNIRSTCNTCRLKNSLHKSKVRQNKENQPFEEGQLIEFEDLADELLFAIDEHVDNQENIEYNDQREQKSQFEFTKIINIPFCSEEPKKIADIIIENVQDADDYKWKYVSIVLFISNVKILYQMLKY
jgi:hypothetical protein